MSITLDPALSVQEFAKAEGVSVATVYNLLARGALTAHKAGRRTVILPEERLRYRAALPVMVSRMKPPKTPCSARKRS